jgi:hypothetical protein
MFFVIVAFLFVDRFLHDKPSIIRYLLILVTPGVGVMIKSIMNVDLVPWGIDSIFIGLSFVMIGNEIARHKSLSSWSIQTPIDIILVLISMLVVVFLSNFNGFVNIGEGLYGVSIYLHMITGVLGTYNLAVFCYHLCRFPRILGIFSSFNKYGQEIYEIHPLFININAIIFQGIVVWDIFLFYPDNPIFIFNILFGVVASWFVASHLIRRSRILRFMFIGTNGKHHKTSVVMPSECEPDTEKASPIL